MSSDHPEARSVANPFRSMRLALLGLGALKPNLPLPRRAREMGRPAGPGTAARNKRPKADRNKRKAARGARKRNRRR